MDIWTLLTGGGEEKKKHSTNGSRSPVSTCVSLPARACVCVVFPHTNPRRARERAGAWTRTRAEVGARICLLVRLFVCFADVGVGRGRGGDGRGAGGCWCANVHHVEGLWMGRCDVKKGPERRCLSRGCQRHSMSYSWGLPFKATAPARLPRHWEEIKLFGPQH